MKAVFTKVVAAASLVLFANVANAMVCSAPNTIVVVNGVPKCVAPPTELPAPSSPLLFLGAALVAGAVLKLRKN